MHVVIALSHECVQQNREMDDSLDGDVYSVDVQVDELGFKVERVELKIAFPTAHPHNLVCA